MRHAWVRGIADYHFTVPGEIDEAIAAYLKVANGGNDSQAVRRVALQARVVLLQARPACKDSIQRFDESVKLYDAIVAAGGTPPLELRDESIQYISVAFTDPWEGETDTDPVKAFERAQAFYKGRENEPHVRDVWVAMGKAFAELQAWDQAVDAYRIAIGPPWELNPKNPVVHQEIVNAFETKGDKFAADAAAAELATRYAPGTAWYAANEKDREAMDNQRRIAERALYAATRNTHSAATTMRKDYEAVGEEGPGRRSRSTSRCTPRRSSSTARSSRRTPSRDYIYEFNFLAGRGAVLERALPRGDRRSTSGSAITATSAPRTTSTRRARSCSRTRPRPQRQVAEGKLAALKVPTVAELKALPQPLAAAADPRRSTSSSRPSTTTTRTSSRIRRRRRSRASTPR